MTVRHIATVSGKAGTDTERRVHSGREQNNGAQFDEEQEEGTGSGNEFHEEGTELAFRHEDARGTDVNGMTRSVAVTTASVHDSVIMEEPLHGEEKEVYGDEAYVSCKKREEFEESGTKWKVHRKSTVARKLDEVDKEYSRECGRTRSRVEHVFGAVKNLWGYRKARYRGLRKNGAQVYALVALANFYMARDKLLKLSPC